MGLEFKPYLSWEDEGGQDRYANKWEEKQTTQPTEGVALQPSIENSNSPLISSGVQQNHHSNHHIGNGNGNAHAIAASAANGAHGIVNEAERENRGAAAGAVVTSASAAAAAAAAAAAGAAVNRGGELAPALAAMNSDNREYAVLVASEEESGAEYKSYFSIVLDYPQFLGQGETKESAIRQASRLLHYAFGSMLLKNESIPAPTSGAELEAKKAAMQRDWLVVRLEHFSMELAPLQFQPGIDYLARPPESDGEYESDREDEELFELESRLSTP